LKSLTKTHPSSLVKYYDNEYDRLTNKPETSKSRRPSKWFEQRLILCQNVFWLCVTEIVFWFYTQQKFTNNIFFSLWQSAIWKPKQGKL
jgi:hypothetical protein